MAPDGATDHAEDLSQEEIDDYKELRTLFSPTETVRVLDQFAAWLFTSAAVVGTLGAGFGVSGLSRVHGTGETFFVAAVVSVSVSLALAALARAPFRVNVNRYDFSSLRGAHVKVATVRFWLLICAAALFALALLLAGLAPAFST